MARKNPLHCALNRLLTLFGLFVTRFRFSKSISKLHFFVLALLPLVNVCCNSKLNSDNYVKWIRDYSHNVHVQTSIADFIFDLQYQPTEYVLLQRGIQNYSADVRVKELEALSAIQYYTLTLATKNKIDLIRYGVTTPEEQQQKLYYFSYQFQQDITLEEDGKILPCILFHAERPVNTNNGRTFVLGFESVNKKSTEAKVVIKSDLLSTLPIKIEVAKSNIPPVEL